MGKAGPFGILFVCTANICRSPVAEVVANTYSAAAGWAVAAKSAGIEARIGAGMDGPCADVVARWGLDPSGHVAQQFTLGLADTADLILTADTSQRDFVIRVVPSVHRRSFTMREFARLARHAEPCEPKIFIHRLAAIRSIDGPVPTHYNDIPDPYGRSSDEVVRVVTLVADTARAVVDSLGAALPVPVVARSRPRPYPLHRPDPRGKLR